MLPSQADHKGSLRPHETIECKQKIARAFRVDGVDLRKVAHIAQQYRRFENLVKVRPARAKNAAWRGECIGESREECNLRTRRGS